MKAGEELKKATEKQLVRIPVDTGIKKAVKPVPGSTAFV
jgi:hypothetical protein